MSAIVPHKGTVQAHTRKPKKAHPKKNNHAGTYRSDVGFDHADGSKITLRAEKGITDEKVLTTPFRFQCPPIGELERPLSSPWPTFATLSAGQRSRPEGAALEIWQLETLFMWDYEPFVVWTGTSANQPNAVNGVFEPQLFIEELKAIAEADAIFRLVIEDPNIWGAYQLVNSLATLTGVIAKQKAGEVGTEYMTLTFQQFREIELNQQGRRRKSATDRERTYLVKTSDTLAEIARRELGRPSEWRRIAGANGIKGVHSNDAQGLQLWLLAHHKTTLKIPAIPRHAKRPAVRRSSSEKARGT